MIRTLPFPSSIAAAAKLAPGPFLSPGRGEGDGGERKLKRFSWFSWSVSA